MRHEVCVVGAGGAGLAAGQALAARGIPFRILEARDGIGGMWRHGETFAYDSLTSNTSRYRTSFRAHRISRRGRPFIHHTEFLAYLESFADRFGLREHVELNTRVERAEPAGDGWEVTVEGREPEPFRALVVATGVLGRPRRREIPGDFEGRRLHSGEYRGPAAFAGQDVVVAGIGSSGAEIAGELVDHARSVTLAVRTGVHVAPKHILPRVPLDALDTKGSARLVSWAGRRRVVELQLRLLVGRPGAHGLPAPRHRLFDEPPTLSDTFVRAVKRGRFDIRPGIERLDGRSVVFADGSTREADAIVFASGYDPGLGYLPPELVEGYGEHHMPLVRGIAHRHAEGLYFVGMTVAPGALLPVFEAQSAWIAAVLAGDLPVPGPSERETMLAEEARRNARDFGRPHSAWRDRRRYIAFLEKEVTSASRRRGGTPGAAPPPEQPPAPARARARVAG
jgi:cation diffusion facilitator CzcD-associated flavoprotein CzcO